MLLIRSEFLCCKVLIALSLGGVFYRTWLSVALTNGLFIRRARETGREHRIREGVGLLLLLLWVFCGRVEF